jgi:hypothetical protein
MNSIRSARYQVNRLVEIDPVQPFSGHIPVGSTVTSITGQVWLTQEGLPDDIILGAGESFVVRRKGIIVMSGLRGAALVHLSAGAQERAGGRVIFTPDFLDAAHARAAELRREALARSARAAWGYVMTLVERTKAVWRNSRPRWLRV